MATLLERRRLRREEQKRDNPKEGQIMELLNKITPDMLVDIKDIEYVLIEHGRYYLTSREFCLKRRDPILVSLGEIEIKPRELSTMILDDRLDLGFALKNPSRIDLVSASTEYMETKIKPFLEERDIEVKITNRDKEWCNVHLTIKGDK